MKKRVLREKKSHEENDVLKQSLKLKEKFKHITLYPGIQKMMKNLKIFIKIGSRRLCLIMVVGKVIDSLKLLQSGAIVYGIDIAKNYIERNL